MKYIVLTKGHKIIVDDKAYELLSVYSWCSIQKPNAIYAIRKIEAQLLMTNKVDSKFKLPITLWMHRLVAGYPKEYGKIYFRDGNSLNCTKENIYVKYDYTDTDSLGFFGKSIFKGVVWDAYLGIWRAEIAGLTIGYYRTETEAALAYNVKSVALFGDKKEVNII